MKKSNFRLVSVDSFYTAFLMGIIRNSCRMFMTHNQKRLSFYDQIHWYINTYTPKKEKNLMNGYVLFRGIIPIGYGFIHKEQNKIWVSGGIHALFRGRGYGTVLFKKLCDLWSKDKLWLEVFRHNTKAFKIYQNLGFRAVVTGVTEKGVVIVMKRGKIA